MSEISISVFDWRQDVPQRYLVAELRTEHIPPVGTVLALTNTAPYPSRWLVVSACYNFAYPPSANGPHGKLISVELMAERIDYEEQGYARHLW